MFLSINCSWPARSKFFNVAGLAVAQDLLSRLTARRTDHTLNKVVEIALDNFVEDTASASSELAEPIDRILLLD
jgi:hypothetical protein